MLIGVIQRNIPQHADFSIGRNIHYITPFNIRGDFSPLILRLICGNSSANLARQVNTGGVINGVTNLNLKVNGSAGVGVRYDDSTIPMNRNASFCECFGLLKVDRQVVQNGSRVHNKGHHLSVVTINNRFHLKGNSAGLHRDSLISDKHNSVREGRITNGFPHVIEIVPVHTTRDILLGELIVVVIHLEPLTVNQNSLNVLHECQFSRCDFLNHIRVSTNLIEPLIVESSEVINQHQLTHEVSLIHVESGGQHIYIVLCIVLAIHENILVTLRRGSMHALGVELGFHKGQQVRSSTELHSCVLHVTIQNGNRVHLTTGDALDNQILEQQVLIILGGGVNGIDNLCNQILHTVDRSESLLQVLILDSNRVLHTPVHSVESRTHIGKSTFQLTVSRLFGGELTSLSNVYEHFLNSLTKLKITLLEFRIGVVKDGRLNTHKGDTVNQRSKEIVSTVRITINHFTDARDILRITNLRNQRLILIRCICTNRIEDINRARIKLCHSNSLRHYSVTSLKSFS
nr:MAG TPA: hypothetical protein [Caudoviricetes sp.]